MGAHCKTSQQITLAYMLYNKSSPTGKMVSHIGGPVINMGNGNVCQLDTLQGIYVPHSITRCHYRTSCEKLWVGLQAVMFIETS